MGYSYTYGLPEIIASSPTPELRARRTARLDSRRAKSSTSKACEGCGTKGRYRSFRPPDEVCDDCLITIWAGEDAKHYREAAKAPPETEYLRIPTRRWSDSPAWPRLYGGRGMDSRQLAPLNSAVANLVYTLLSRSVIEQPDYGESSKSRSVPQLRDRTPSYYVLAPPGSGDAIMEIDKALSQAIEDTFNAGAEYGRKLLFQLGEGSITLDDLSAGREKQYS